MTQIEYGDHSPAEVWADRADAFNVARALVTQYSWGEPVTVQDVVSVAMLLMVGGAHDD